MNENEVDEMRAEYDFSGGVRGKYYEQFKQGTNLVLLDPDVAKAFGSAKLVNSALREYMLSRKHVKKTGIVS